MARRRRRRKVARAATPRRRRRHAVAKRRRSVVRHHATNPRRRRRRSYRANSHRTHRRRRSYHRNPAFGLGFLAQGLKDGAVITVGQIATRKLSGLASNYVPGLSPINADGSKNLIGIVGSRLAAGLVIGFASRRLAPQYSRLLVASAMSEVINAGLAASPAAPFLGAMPIIRRPGVSGYVRNNPARPGVTPGGRVGAWPVIRMPQKVG